MNNPGFESEHSRVPESPFRPFVHVIHRNPTPSPILPVDFSYFLRASLPSFTVALPLPSQLLVAKRATASRRSYGFTGPFGAIEALAFHRSQHVTIYLTAKGDFAGEPDLPAFPSHSPRCPDDAQTTPQ